MIDAARSGKLRPLDVDRRIANAIALRPLLVALNAGKRASTRGTARTAVFVGSDVT